MSNTARYTFEVEGLTQELRVMQFIGEEAISRLFEFKLTIACDDPEIDLASALGRPGVLKCFNDDDSVARHVNGIVERIEQSEQVGRFSLYEFDLVPQVKLLSFRNNSRIFQNKSVSDIIRQVLTDAAVPSDQFRFLLQQQYEPREYCVQYQETDLNFVSRLMEEEGIFFYFEHASDSHTLLITDNDSAHETILGDDAIVFHEPGSLVATAESVTTFRVSEEIRPGRVVLQDFDFKRPALSLLSEKRAQTNAELEVFEYPGAYHEPSEGLRRAQARLDALQAAKTRGAGSSDCKRLVPGFRFTLTDHPRDDFNREYIVTDVYQDAAEPQILEESAGDEGSRYNNRFQCVPAGVAFRSGKNTRKPTVQGIQTAIVVGPSGEEIYTDEHGRVKVQFHWDRLGTNNENSSCWIRVSQLWAGAGWGAMFIPRIGQEVIVDFIEGDPDRPLITGRVYHGTNRPPYGLPAEKTKSTIKSNSSKGGGGANEIRFEDKKDSEEIYMHGQRNLDVLIENDKSQEVKNDETLRVGNNRDKTIGNDETETVGGNKTISVGKNHSESIGESASINVGKNTSISIGDSLSVDIANNRSENIGGDHSESIGNNSDLNIGNNFGLDIGKNYSQSVGKELAIDIGTNGSISIGKDLSITAGKKALIEASDQLTLVCGKAKIVMKKDGTVKINGKDIQVKGSGNVAIKGSKIAQN